MSRRTLLSVTTLALFAMTACDGSPTARAEGDISAAEAEELASVWDEVGASIIDGAAGPLLSLSAGAEAAAFTTTTTFSRQHDCPRGGTSTLAGQRVVTGDAATRTGSFGLTATRTDAACAFSTRRGEGALTLTGAPNMQVTAQQAWTAGVPGQHTATTRGAFTWARSTGQSGSCTVDITSTRTPSTRTYTVAGTFCGREVSITRTRS